MDRPREGWGRAGRGTPELLSQTLQRRLDECLLLLLKCTSERGDFLVKRLDQLFHLQKVGGMLYHTILSSLATPYPSVPHPSD